MSLSDEEKIRVLEKRILRLETMVAKGAVAQYLFCPSLNCWLPGQCDEQGRQVIDPSDLDTRYLMVNGSNYMKANASVRPEDSPLTGRGLLGTLLSGYGELAPAIRLWNLLDNEKFVIMFTQGYPLDMYHLAADDTMISNPMYFDGSTMFYECDANFVGELIGLIARISFSWQNYGVTEGAFNCDFNFLTPLITDGTYGVLVTPNWSTRVWVTLKTSTTFKVNFSVQAPAGATVDLLMFKDSTST